MNKKGGWTWSAKGGWQKSVP